MTNREAGEALVREARRIFNRDLYAAWEDRDYNLAVRRAQEAVRAGRPERSYREFSGK